MRFFTLTGNSLYGNVMPLVWVDSLMADGARAIVPYDALHTSVPGSPTTPGEGGSVLETYMYGQNAASGLEACVMLPNLDICEGGPTWPTANGWQKATATVNITGVAMEGEVTAP
jgi:hypothetical protein